MDRYGCPRPPRVLRQRPVAGPVAVGAALSKPWSNGQTEGQTTRLELVKRQMYGQAKLDLLEARLTGAG